MVALEKNDYVQKMEDMLSDENTYTVIQKDPLKKLTTDRRSLLVRWKREGYIDNVTYRRMLISDGVLPRAYGLTKHFIHYPHIYTI